jgi:vacuolar protein sorting-associated protein 51
MDPLSPSTSTLAPAISHIAETAASLSTELQSQNAGAQREQSKTESEVELVTWILKSPYRLKSLIEAGQRREAAHQWSVIQKVLDRWKGVRGTDDVRSACQKVIQDFSGE